MAHYDVIILNQDGTNMNHDDSNFLDVVAEIMTES